MKVILKQDVKKLGVAGDIKEVANGYAQNFLFPQGLADPATEETIKKAEEIRKKREKEAKKRREEFAKIASEIQGKEFKLKAKEKDGKLFGSIGQKEIAQKIKEEGCDINEKAIELSSPIKEIGEQEIQINFSEDVRASVKIIIEKE